MQTHPITLTTRGHVFRLVLALRAPGSSVRQVLATVNRFDKVRVASGGELPTLETSLQIQA